jgi:hypothetical protein
MGLVSICGPWSRLGRNVSSLLRKSQLAPDEIGSLVITRRPKLSPSPESPSRLVRFESKDRAESSSRLGSWPTLLLKWASPGEDSIIVIRYAAISVLTLIS